VVQARYLIAEMHNQPLHEIWIGLRFYSWTQPSQGTFRWHSDQSGVNCRFRFTDQLDSLFDAIDVHTQGQNLPPGSYRCVAQYPRRVFTEGTPGSLRDVGLAQAKQETVLIEPID